LAANISVDVDGGDIGQAGTELTQVDVAVAPRSRVSRCEAGQRRVEIVESQDFARRSGVSLNFFVR